KNDEEDIEINSDSQSESSTLASSDSDNENEKISSSSKQMDSQIHSHSSSIESKTKQRNRNTTPVKLTNFLRLERTNNHIGAAELLDNLKFRGRPISVKINNLPSNKSQWLAANDEYKNINLHSEKVKLIRHLAEQANKNHPNQEICQLKNEIEVKNEQIESLNLNLELANSKIFQLNNRLSKIQLESNSKDEERLKLI
ncbi:unnamed protein product, partial [Brachionus calyciflorus]